MALGNLLINTDFKVIAQQSIGDVREELITGSTPERLAEIGQAHKADILICGNVDTKAGEKSSLLKNADMQPYIIAGSFRAVHCATGDTYFSELFNQPATSTSMEKARQMGLKKALSLKNAKDIAKPLLARILHHGQSKLLQGNSDLSLISMPRIHRWSQSSPQKT